MKLRDHEIRPHFCRTYLLVPAALAFIFFTIAGGCMVRTQHHQSQIKATDVCEAYYINRFKHPPHRNRHEMTFDMHFKCAPSHGSKVEIFRLDSDEVEPRKVGNTDSANPLLVDPNLEDSKTYRYEIKEKDSTGKPIQSYITEVVIPRDHLIPESGKHFNLETDSEKRFGVTDFTENSFFHGLGSTANNNNPFNQAFPDSITSFFYSDIGVFAEGSALLSDPRWLKSTYDSVAMPTKLHLVFKRARGSLTLDPYLHLRGQDAFNPERIQNIFLSVENVEEFKLKYKPKGIGIPFFDPVTKTVKELPIKKIKPVRAGFVRIDLENDSYYFVEDRFLKLDSMLGIFESTDPKRETVLWFSPVTGEGTDVTWTKDDVFTAGPWKWFLLSQFSPMQEAPNPIDNNHWRKIPPERLTSQQRLIVQLQQQVLRLDRMFARSGVRVDISSRSCKNAAYSEKQFQLALAIENSVSQITNWMKSNQFESMFFHCHHSSNLFGFKKAFYIGTAFTETPRILLRKWEEGLLPISDLPDELQEWKRLFSE